MTPLEEWRKQLGERPYAPPHFDPLDAGVDARVLILLQSPGPSAHSVRFVSRDNPTGTARNLRKFLEASDLARRQTVLWNTVPWVLAKPGSRNIAPSLTDIDDGLATIPSLLARLPNLQVIVLMGRVAAMAQSLIKASFPAISVVITHHPSPTFVNSNLKIAAQITEALKEASTHLSWG